MLICALIGTRCMWMWMWMWEFKTEKITQKIRWNTIYNNKRFPFMKISPWIDFCQFPSKHIVWLAYTFSGNRNTDVVFRCHYLYSFIHSECWCMGTHLALAHSNSRDRRVRLPLLLLLLPPLYSVCVCMVFVIRNRQYIKWVNQRKSWVVCIYYAMPRDVSKYEITKIGRGRT